MASVGLYAFARGILAYRTAAAVSGIATSSTTSLAAGEVRITGVAEPWPTTPSRPSRAHLRPLPLANRAPPRKRHRHRHRRRALGELPTARPRGHGDGLPARCEVGATPRFAETSGAFDDPPPGLKREPRPRHDRDRGRPRGAQIPALLTVRQPVSSDPAGLGTATTRASGQAAWSGSGRRGSASAGAPVEQLEIREERVEPGDTITVVASAVPYGEMEQMAADGSGEAASPLEDPEIAADLAEVLP